MAKTKNAPKKDKLAEPVAEIIPEDSPYSDVLKSPYDEDIEVVDPDYVEPAKELSKEREWVYDPGLLRKVEGYRDTLSGTLYYGVRK